MSTQETFRCRCGHEFELPGGRAEEVQREPLCALATVRSVHTSLRAWIAYFMVWMAVAWIVFPFVLMIL